MTLNTKHYKEKLEEEKALLEKELSEIAAQNPQNKSDWNAREDEHRERADMNMAADIQEDMRERHAISDELEKRLENVRLALEKIEKGGYGMCEIGKEPIEEERLKANPAAQTCKKHLNDI